MAAITITISEDELLGVLTADQTLKDSLEKAIPLKELYKSEFIDGLNESINDVKKGLIKEVHSFEEFIQ